MGVEEKAWEVSYGARTLNKLGSIVQSLEVSVKPGRFVESMGVWVWLKHGRVDAADDVGRGSFLKDNNPRPGRCTARIKSLQPWEFLKKLESGQFLL